MTLANHSYCLRFICVFCVLSTIGIPLYASTPSPQQLRGQQIYLSGKSPSGTTIKALLPNAHTAMPASILPCVNCHRYDGRGQQEGGVTPADIRGQTLYKTYGLTRANGKFRPAYNARTLKRAIAMGIDANGETLNAIMPRYQLNQQDMADLIAYLSGLGTYRDTGISDATINIGVILPRHHPKKNKAVQNILHAHFSEVNSQGGIFQRRIQPVFITPPTDNDNDSLAQFSQTLAASNVFAYTASDINGLETHIIQHANQFKVPFVGALSTNPNLQFPLNRYIFYLSSGLAHQTQALLNFSEKKINSAAIIERLPEFSMAKDWFRTKHTTVKTYEFSPEENTKNTLISLIKTLKKQEVEQVYLLTGSPSQARFFAQAENIQWRPRVFLLGTHMGTKVFNSPAPFDQRIFVAFANSPLAYQPDALNQYQQLLKKYAFNKQTPNAQLLALASAKLLTEVLIRSTRELSREKLIHTLESVYQFDTSLTPALSFGPNRRVGYQGAYVVRMDLANKTIVPVSGWLPVN